MTMIEDPPAFAGNYGSGAINRAVDAIGLAGRTHVHRAIYAGSCGLAELTAGAQLTAAQADRARALLLTTGLAARGPGHHGEVERAIAAGWAKGLTQPRSAPGGWQMLRDHVDTIEAICDWWAAAAAQPAPDRRWATTLKILAALALEAVAGRCTYVSVSHRQLAETAGVSAGTITKHLDALAPWASVGEAGDPATGLASRWRLLVGRASGNIPALAGEVAPQVFPSAHPMLIPSHNLWHRWSGGWAVMLTLADQPEPVSAAALADQIGRSIRSMPRILAKLQALGLIRSTSAGWISLLDHVSDQDAQELHDNGIDYQAARRARHRAERALWDASPLRKAWLHAREARERRRIEHQDQHYWTIDDGGNLVACIPNTEAA